VKAEPASIKRRWQVFCGVANDLTKVTDHQPDALKLESLRDGLFSCLHILSEAIKRGDRAALEQLYLLTLEACSRLKQAEAENRDLVHSCRDWTPRIDKLIAALPEDDDGSPSNGVAGTPSELAERLFREISEVKRWHDPGWSKMPRRTQLAVQKLRIDAKSAIKAETPRQEKQLLKVILKLPRLSPTTHKRWWTRRCSSI